MYKSRAVFVYTPEGRSNIAYAKNKAGVYIIYNLQGQPVYIGYSAGQLEKTIMRHFQSWKDPRQVRVSYADKYAYKVRIVITTQQRAQALERALIIKYKPKDNPDKLQLYAPSSFENDMLNEFEEAGVKTVKEMEDAPF